MRINNNSVQSALFLRMGSNSILDGISHIFHIGRVQATNVDATVLQQVNVMFLCQILNLHSCILERIKGTCGEGFSSDLRLSPVNENMPVWLITCSQEPGVPLAFNEW